jgi:hemerythrin superfamily protein
MARAKRKSRARRNTRASQRGRSSRAATDAISLLKADHREVEELFEQFEKARSDDRKLELAGRICAALKMHTMIEAEIFYPAFLQATEETDIHHEAEVEHDGAKKLIAEIEASGPQDEYYHAKVTVLSEMIKHHVNEEEKRDGMFAKARQSDMDLQALGEQLANRKQELQAQGQGQGATGRRSVRGVMGRMTESMRH